MHAGLVWCGLVLGLACKPNQILCLIVLGGACGCMGNDWPAVMSGRPSELVRDGAGRDRVGDQVQVSDLGNKRRSRWIGGW